MTTYSRRTVRASLLVLARVARYPGSKRDICSALNLNEDHFAAAVNYIRRDLGGVLIYDRPRDEYRLAAHWREAVVYLRERMVDMRSRAITTIDLSTSCASEFPQTATEAEAVRTAAVALHNTLTEIITLLDSIMTTAPSTTN